MVRCSTVRASHLTAVGGCHYIALPSMRESFGASAADVQWIVAGYSLAFGLALVPGGSLGDLYGRKHLFLAAVSVFLLAGVAATGSGPGTLIGARLVQGAAAGLANSQVIGTIRDVFHGMVRGRALGMYAVTGGVAAALGPALGGALVAGLGPEAGRRCCLLLSAPCAVITLTLAVRRLSPLRRTARDARLDGSGAVTVASGRHSTPFAGTRIGDVRPPKQFPRWPLPRQRRAGKRVWGADEAPRKNTCLRDLAGTAPASCVETLPGACWSAARVV
ncbi:MFS transporter [Streptomyces aurantiacus]|uniref:MFS transporter n=1 Tax=Streptomyces aurantiacus TaxID=47760 RepID=UPI0027D7E440|nr:MFS transporter [Streptomyces aurantiacus]